MKSLCVLVLALPLVADVAFATPVTQGRELVFSIDWHSASLGSLDSTGTLPITEADVLRAFGGSPGFQAGGLPELVVSGADLGIPLYAQCSNQPGCGIEVDALSDGESPPLPSSGDYSIYFSVDEYAVGVQSGVTASVFTEAPFGDSAADVFVHPDNRMGPLGPGAPPTDTPNVVSVDGDGFATAAVSIVGVGLVEPNPPTGNPPPDLGDNVDAFEVVDPGAGAQRVFFSLDAGFMDPDQGVPNSGSGPSNGFSGSVILRSNLAGNVQVFATAGQLGLTPFDDVDALSIATNGIPDFQPSQFPYDWESGATDMVLFSVRKGSPVVGLTDSIMGLPIEPGDILTTPLAGSPGARPGIFIAAEVLGLSTGRAGGPADDVDGTEVEKKAFDDCNNNYIADHADIQKGTSDDDNANGIPDECEPPGEPYCGCATPVCVDSNPSGGCPNSAGNGAVLLGFGSSSVFRDDLFLRVTGLPPGQFALVYLGGADVQFPFGGGYRCVGGGGIGTFRFGVQGTGPGTIVETLLAETAGEAYISAGSTRFLQCWYRDPGGPCGTFFNFSNGWRVAFSL